jgi:sporulation protein YlmC with PRC-barrel domain
MAKKERLRRDIAGVGPEPRRTGLHPLSGLKDFRISKGEPDIRGWEVRTLSGRDVGRVDDLLVDTDAGEVVMLDIEMRGSDRHIELPIRSAQLDHGANRVLVDSGDVDLYAAPSGSTRTGLDRDDRSLVERDRDRDNIPDRVDPDIDDERTRRLRERDRDPVPDRLERQRTPEELEEDRLNRSREHTASTHGTADEVVVERRPVIEEVVIRRKVVDSE